MSEFLQREFPMTDADFKHIADKAYEISGIVLKEHKRSMVYSRLSRRIRELKLSTFDQYLSYLSKNETLEMSDFINSLTTNLTSFFRENHHFEYMRDTIIPSWRSKTKVRIWSAGCSTGEEPYSIAMTLISEKMNIRNTKILATDLDSNVLEHCAKGHYSADKIKGLPASLLNHYFIKKAGGDAEVKESLRQLITFNRLNLLGQWPMKGKFNLIFCRNVVIYFDKPTQKILFDRYADMLEDGGYLFIGHSESMNGLTDRFKSVGRTMFQKVY
jgi:chemotaxis protein methyltransferase CheR